MPGDLASAIGLYELTSIIGKLVKLSALARCVDTGVFQEQNCVRSLA